MRHRDRYLFDLQGYLTVPDALSTEAVEELNEAVDGMAEREIGPEETAHRWFHLLARSRAFRALIDNPPVLPILEELLGKEFRLDHEYVDLIRSGMGPIGSGLHGGAVPFRPIEYYWSGGGQLHSGLVVVAYNLKNVGPDDGGFACVPGSHKSTFAYPDDWKDLSDPHPCVRAVCGPAGSAIVFTEALEHGTLPWRGRDERRTVFYKTDHVQLARIGLWTPASATTGMAVRRSHMLYAGRLEDVTLLLGQIRVGGWVVIGSRPRQRPRAVLVENGTSLVPPPPRQRAVFQCLGEDDGASRGSAHPSNTRVRV